VAVYTLGIWKVKSGAEDEFVAAWTEFARWSADHAPGSSWVKLLRDREHPNRFISVGPWDSLEAIEAWRELEGWKQRIGEIRGLLEGFEAVTLDSAAELE
jgi:heme-degrading monooxygenase HmoA